MALKIPPSIVAGTSPSWIDTFSDYSAAAGWSLTYYFAGSQSFNISATAQGNDFALAIVAATSTSWLAGIYQFQAFVTNGTQRILVGSGSFQVEPSFVTQSGAYDGRSDNQKLLDLVNAAISSILAGQGVQKYMIRGRLLERYSIKELRDLRTELKSEVSREQAAADRANGKGDPRTLFARFGGF